jgi:hypothetical protein
VSSDRLFQPGSAWNLAIPSNPALDAASGAQVAYLSSGTNPGIADLYDFGVPIWDADASTPKYRIDCTRAWGTCELERELVPIPDNARPSMLDRLGGDGAMVVIDWSTRKAYEFYAAEKTSSGWTTGWGGIVSIDGPGTPGQAVGAGLSRLAGVVRADEIASGVIDHALVLSTNNACPSVYRYPASKTDGRSSRSDCVPEGARIQLDPSIDVNALAGATRAEKIVARALQVYGAYVIDNGGAKMAYIFEVPSGEADPYCGSGLCSDYQAMQHIPWSRLRVLRAWNGS